MADARKQTLAQDLRDCPWCEEEHPLSSFEELAGWWVRPMDGIEWDDMGGIPTIVFSLEEPDKGRAWRCQCGCIMRNEPEPAVEYGEPHLAADAHSAQEDK